MLSSAPCPGTVWIIEALLFGTGEDCVSLAPVSVVTAAAAFILSVVLLKLALRPLVMLIFSHRTVLKADRASPLARDGALRDRSEPAPAPAPVDPGPIRSHVRR